MTKTRRLSCVVILPLLFLAPAVLSQEAEKKMPVRPAPEGVRCDPDTCESKVFYLPNFSMANELQDVVNTFRLILDIPRVSGNQSEHTISLQGTPEQLAIAEKLETVLESLSSSGDHNRSSVLVYKPPPEEPLEQSSVGATNRCELTTCFIKALYLPDFSISQLQGAVNKLYKTVQVGRVCMVPHSHAIVFQGTSQQVALADELMNQ